ncbi:MAG: zinc ABC transporter substrate-binding protein, partial [Syntrophorhabdaceae bacterium]|nr:zinc ABC transporter substrate-binding protein [Syntrophorhabdaceae bacterium]
MKRGLLKKIKVVYPILFVCIILFLSASCGRKEDTTHTQKKLKVVATLFTLYDFARNIAGDKADVSLLLPPGIEAHSFDPKPADIMKINAADLFIFTGKYMEPWSEKVLRGVDNKKLIVIDTSKGIELISVDANKKGHNHNKKDYEGHRHGVYDPHIWLDLSNAQKMVETIRDGMIQKDPKNTEAYIKNAETYKARLDELDKRYKKTLSTCRQNTIIHGGHFAFNYLAERYNLKYYAAYKTSPNAEPTPKQVIELKNRISQSGIKYIFHEEM